MYNNYVLRYYFQDMKEKPNTEQVLGLLI